MNKSLLRQELHGSSSGECTTCCRYTISYLSEQSNLAKMILFEKGSHFKPSDCSVLITLASPLNLLAFYGISFFLPSLLQQTESSLRAGLELYPYRSRPDHFYPGELKHRISQTSICIRIIGDFLANLQAFYIVGFSPRVYIVTSCSL